MRSTVCAALLLAAPATARGQTSGPPELPARPRALTVTAGVGNSFGWFGLQGEHYFARERLAALVGVGYAFAVYSGDPHSPAFAAGLRAYTRGQRHRGFLQATVSLQAMTMECPLEGWDATSTFDSCWSHTYYGPGLEAGWQYASRGGFTLLAGMGLGWSPGIHDGTQVTPQISFGLGYTWRRRGGSR